MGLQQPKEAQMHWWQSGRPRPPGSRWDKQLLHGIKPK